MKKKSASQSAFFRLRALIAFLLCTVAVCSVLTVPLLAFLRPQEQVNGSQRTLTFEERVSYQRAVEEVYWRHRIWPKERKDPKPSLDTVMSQTRLEKKVSDYLRNSQALEDYWQRPITADQLQAEMDRMATHTRQAEMLRELFGALGNDPFVIAECLARPALAERLLTSWFASDQRIHGELKQRAEAELQSHPSAEQMRQLSGTYTEIQFVRGESPQAKQNHDQGHSINLNALEWDKTLQRLTKTFSDHSAAAGVSPTTGHPVASGALPANNKWIKTGVLTPLQEDADRYHTTAVMELTKDRMKLAAVSWLKEPLDSWLARAESRTLATTKVPAPSYTLPTIPDGATCVDNTWTAAAGPPDIRYGQTAVWTGSEMIIWGGGSSGYPNFSFRNTGARYNPSTDTWANTSIFNAPDGRASHTAVWTGTEMIIWGGFDGLYSLTDTGGRYNPSTNSWRATSTIGAPAPRELHAAVWTGSKMIVWGGVGDGYSILAENTTRPQTDGARPAPAMRLQVDIFLQPCGRARK